MFDPPSQPTMPRLIALLEAGYRIDHGVFRDVRNALWLEHPARKRTDQRLVILFHDGLLVGDARHGDEAPRIYPDDDEGFRRFLARIPRPTWWERNCDPFYVGLAWVIIAVVAAIGYAILDAVWDFLRELF